MRPATLALVLAVATLAAGCGQRDDRPAGSPTLRVGDPAPRLRVTRWLNGEPVTRFEPGKVYVLDFWATWCGPCLRSMPHLGKLAKEHEAAGLVVIPVTTVTGSNSRSAIDTFVLANGPQLGLTFGVCDDRRMEDAWFEASGQNGIPCSFVVDRAGKIAFIGHPMELDAILPGLLGGAGPGDPK